MEKAVIFAALICFLFESAAAEVVFETESYVVVAVSVRDVFTLSEWREMKAEIESKYQKRYLEKQIVVTRDATVYYGLRRALEENDRASAQFFADKALNAA